MYSHVLLDKHEITCFPTRLKPVTHDISATPLYVVALYSTSPLSIDAGAPQSAIQTKKALRKIPICQYWPIVTAETEIIVNSATILTFEL